MKPLVVLLFCVVTISCRTTSRPGLFSKKTPHETYGNKISDAGLRSTAIGKAWFDAASRAVEQPVNIQNPYREAGFFPADEPGATGFRFMATRGEKLQISVSKKPAGGFKLYLDLWQQDTTASTSGNNTSANRPSNTTSTKLLASSDTTGIAIEHEVDRTGYYILRLQPELLQDCEYTVEISTVASLAFPVRARGNNSIKSYWGADRDAGARRHEGVDIFAAKLTPAVAAADGRVTRVNENRLGGKVVWLRPDRKDYTLYYAHLDTQLVRDGQQVSVGDTLGLVGNTGNARTTPPHLHFGIYAFGGAIDPLPFVNPNYPDAPKINADVTKIGKVQRTNSKDGALYLHSDRKAASVGPLGKNSFVKILAVADKSYRVMLPDGRTGFVPETVVNAPNTMRSVALASDTPLYAKPDSLAPRKQILAAGTKVSQIAEFAQYDYIRAESQEGWILKPTRSR